MAKITIYLPDELLKWVEEEAYRQSSPGNSIVVSNIIQQAIREKQDHAESAEEIDMTAQTTEYFTLSTERTEEIVACDANLTPEIVREYTTADWAEGEEHQEWLNAAPASEIADWIIAQIA